MGKELPPWAQKVIQGRSKASEVEVRSEVERRGWTWERLDRQGKNTAKRPEGCIHIGGAPAVLAEVKHVHSGGASSDGTVLLSDLDQDLIDAGVKAFPAIPPAVERGLDDADGKRRALILGRPDYAGLPYVVIFYSTDVVSLNLVDRKMPHRRDISGLVYIERGREFRDALNELPAADLERRVATGDVSGLPDPGILEWRLVPNPYALRPTPKAFRDSCLVGWSGEVAWPESMPPDVVEGARGAIAALEPSERTALKVAYWCFGRVDTGDRNLRDAAPLLDRLAAKGLAFKIDAAGYELTSEGLRLALVADADQSW